MKYLPLLIVLSFMNPQEGRCILPNHEYSRTPASLHLQYDSLNIMSKDNIRLTGWLCKPNELKSSTVVIFASADAGNMSDNLDIVQALVSNLGIRVLVFDYRGFGTSDSFQIDTDLIAQPEFATDIHSVVVWVKENIQNDTNKIVLYGRSMGGSLALTVASLYGQIAGVISESPYVSQELLNSKVLKKYQNEKVKRKVKKIDSNLIEPIAVINRCNCNVLFIHGQDESFVLTDEIFKLYTKCASRKKSLWVVSNANHLEVPFKETSLFFTSFQSFILDLTKDK